jgi:hypothetical protein
MPVLACGCVPVPGCVCLLVVVYLCLGMCVIACGFVSVSVSVLCGRCHQRQHRCCPEGSQ